MNVLGIETSCDETSASVVKDGRYVLANITTSSLKDHRKFGGILPELASRRQLEYINSVVEECLEQSRHSLDEIDAIAVTSNPGLMGSLLVGLSFARALSYSINKPLVEVDHIKAHIYANFLTDASKTSFEVPKLPAIALVVSGGHTNLYHIKNFDSIKILGQTRDDAVGETYDKVARILGLEYPGGPVIDRLAKQVKKSPVRFSCAEMPDSYDFSFSGIKTAVLYHHRDHSTEKSFSIPEVAFSFQESVVSILVKKCMAACKKEHIHTLLLGGGVAANSLLRERLLESGKANNIDVRFPKIQYCLDNAAMIAGLGFHQLR